MTTTERYARLFLPRSFTELTASQRLAVHERLSYLNREDFHIHTAQDRTCERWLASDAKAACGDCVREERAIVRLLALLCGTVVEERF